MTRSASTIATVWVAPLLPAALARHYTLCRSVGPKPAAAGLTALGLAIACSRPSVE